MSSQISRPTFKICRRILSLCLTELIARAHAADFNPLNCTSLADRYIGNPHGFSIASWMSRGICVRQANVEHICWESFNIAVGNLDSLRVAEYAGAANVLALLPTIGALLGAPTSEIWRLLTVIPFEGCLAMTLSFGGAILPVRVEDYENDLNRHRVAVKRTVDFRAVGSRQSKDAQKELYAGLNQVWEKILARMRQDESQQLAKNHIKYGLLGMIVFFIGAQVAMAVVEQGGVIPWWCVSRYWMHMWYFLVALVAIAESWAHFPFKESWKLFVSDVPYDVNIRGGDSILPKLKNPNATAKQVLHQLKSVKAGTATLRGSKQYTRPRNAVIIKVSVANRGPDRYRSFFQLISKLTSIATFILGTAFFASVQLLALPVAVMTLSLTIAAGVFGRAITEWIVTGVNKTEPLIHVVVNTTQEAQYVISQIVSLDKEETSGNEVRKIQVELKGHVFASQRRVGRRSPWVLRTLGVLAEPFDLRKVDHCGTSSNVLQASTDQSEVELGLMRENEG